MKAEELNLETFIELIDNVYDEIFIWDENYTCIYANRACYRHYGLQPADFIGKSIYEWTTREKLWSPSCVMNTFREKKPIIQKQKTILGIDIVTIAVPFFDAMGNVKYIIQSVRDSDQFLFKELEPLHTDEIIEDSDSPISSEFIYRSKKMKRLLEYTLKIAKTDASILIMGETGTGKSYLAKYIHQHSARADKPFMSINMASLSPSIIETEFFGYSGGAFTGARKNGKKGIFEAANGGTLFLDEIGEFPYDLQAKFLHVLQEEEFIPVGETKPVKLDIRFICATNCDLERMIEAGKFRRDLYHRISLMEVTIPPLRERKEDISVFAAHFLNSFNTKYHKCVRLSEDVTKIFQNYLWTGNIRELSNVIERAVIIAENDCITVENLPEAFFLVDNLNSSGKEDESQSCLNSEAEQAYRTDDTYQTALERWEEKMVREAYEANPSSRKLAKALNVSQSKANNLLRKYIRHEKTDF